MALQTKFDSSRIPIALRTYLKRPCDTAATGLENSVTRLFASNNTAATVDICRAHREKRIIERRTGESTYFRQKGTGESDNHENRSLPGNLVLDLLWLKAPGPGCYARGWLLAGV